MRGRSRAVWQEATKAVHDRNHGTNVYAGGTSTVHRGRRPSRRTYSSVHFLHILLCVDNSVLLRDAHHLVVPHVQWYTDRSIRSFCDYDFESSIEEACHTVCRLGREGTLQSSIYQPEIRIAVTDAARQK